MQVPSHPFSVFAEESLTAKTLFESGSSAAKDILRREYFLMQKESKSSPLYRSIAFLEAVTASAMLTIAGVPDVNLLKLAMHPIAVEFTFRHTAGDALVHIPSHTLPSSYAVFPFFRKIS